MRIAVVQVPYHLGREGVGMGAGPEHLVQEGIAGALERAGLEVEVVRVRRANGETNEIGASFEVVRRVAEAVAGAVQRGAFPLVLAGNCLTSIGVVAGAGRDVGVVWLDAHADFNTTDETLSGFQDGMGLAILTGTGWRALRETVPGFRIVPERDVVLVGARDLDQAEEERLARSPVRVLRPPTVPGGLVPALDALRARAGDVYLHVDLDVLDASEGRANDYASGNGLRAREVEDAVAAVGERFRIRGAALTAYDPNADPAGRIPPLATRIAVRVAAAAALPVGVR